MIHDRTIITVFVSCPGDVETEKNEVKRSCEKINWVMERSGCNVSLEVQDWRNIVGSYGERTQSIINEAFKEYDIYLGVLHMRFGSPTGAINEVTGEDFGSGTIEEFNIAVEKLKEKPESVYMFFKEPGASKTIESTQQLLKVLQFKEQISSTGWVNPCKDTDDFRNKVDRMLNLIALQTCLKKKGHLKTETLETLSSEKNIRVNSGDFSKEADWTGLLDYIPRSITNLKKSIFRVKEWYHYYDDDRNETLTKAVLKYKRIALLGSAGSGKSTELSKLVSDCNLGNLPLIPIYRRFNIYTNQAMNDFLPDGWDKVPAAISLIVLDGLDEVQPQHFFTAVRNIQAFSINNPDVTIVVSCRTNFYQLPDSGSNTLDGFEVFLLDDVAPQKMTEFVKEQRIANPEQFILDSITQGYRDLIGKPFFLKLLINFYNHTGAIEGKRSELFEFIIQSRISFDEQHYSQSVPLQKMRSLIINVLERIALVMESLGVNLISYDNLRKILSHEYLKLLEYFPGFSKSNKNDLWGFEHNNIQEYLAARTLTSESIEKIKVFIGIPPHYDKVKLTWANTLSFLISIINDSKQLQQLIDWIVSADDEILIKFEPSRVPDPIRMKLFKTTFNRAKERDIWTRSSKYTEQELANFVESQDSFEFLLQELADKSNTPIVRTNAIRLLRYFHLDELQKNLLLPVIYDFADQNSDNYDVIHVILYVVRDLFSDYKDVLETLMHKFGSNTNQYVRAGFYALLIDSPFINEYIDYLIDGIEISQASNSGQRNSVNLADETWNLSKAFKNITEPKALKKLIAFFSDPLDRKHHNYFDRTDVIQHIVSNAIEAYSHDHEIYDSILRMFIGHGRFSERGQLELIREFFDTTDTRLQAFKDIWGLKAINDLQYEKRMLLINISDRSCIDYLMKEYENRNITNEEIKSLLFDLTYFRIHTVDDSELVEYFENKVKEKTNIDIARPDIIDYNAIRKQREQDSFNLLFNKGDFEKEIKRIFVEIGKEEIGFNDLWELRKNNQTTDPEEHFVRCVLDLLRDWTRNGTLVKISQLLEWMKEVGKYENYIIQEAYEHLKNFRDIEVNPEQFQIIEAWSNNSIAQVTEEQLVDSNPDEHSFSINFYARLVWFFLKTIHIKIPDNKILSFTLFIDIDKRDNDKSEITIIEELVDKLWVKQKVIDNLLGNKLHSSVWRNNAQYAIENELEKGYPGILNGILDDSLFINDRIEIVKMYFDKVRSEEEMSIIFTLKNIDSVTWLVIDLWDKYGFDQTLISKYLRSLMLSNMGIEDNKWRAAERLIEKGNKEAFDLYTKAILDRSFIIGDSPHRLSVLTQVKDIVLLDRLIELLAFSKNPEFANDVFRTFDNIVISAMRSLALLSAENLKIVTDALHNFIIQHTEINNIKFLYLQIEQMEFDFYMQESQKATIEDIIEKVNEIRPEIPL